MGSQATTGKATSDGLWIAIAVAGGALLCVPAGCSLFVLRYRARRRTDEDAAIAVRYLWATVRSRTRPGNGHAHGGTSSNQVGIHTLAGELKVAAVQMDAGLGASGTRPAQTPARAAEEMHLRREAALAAVRSNAGSTTTEIRL